MKHVLKLVLFSFCFILLACGNKTSDSENGGEKTDTVAIFQNNAELWKYLHTHEFIAEDDTSIVTFNKYKAYLNDVQISEFLEVSSLLPTAASLSGISLKGNRAMLVVNKASNDEKGIIVDMSDMKHVLTFTEK